MIRIGKQSEPITEKIYLGWMTVPQATSWNAKLMDIRKLRFYRNLDNHHFTAKKEAYQD